MRHSYRPELPPQPQPYRTQVLDHLGLVAGMFGLYREYVLKPVTRVLWDSHKERFGP